VGLEIWEDHFLIGSGLGLIAFNNREGVEFGDFSTVAALAEMGLVGFIAFVGLFISLFIVTAKFVVNNKKLEQLPEDLRRLSGMLLYLMIYLLLINFISGNNLVSYVLWLFLGMIFSVINNYYLAFNEKLYTFKLMKTPLNINLQEKTAKYLEKKNEK